MGVAGLRQGSDKVHCCFFRFAASRDTQVEQNAAVVTEGCSCDPSFLCG